MLCEPVSRTLVLFFLVNDWHMIGSSFGCAYALDCSILLAPTFFDDGADLFSTR
jgi:hypothetical protein